MPVIFVSVYSNIIPDRVFGYVWLLVVDRSIFIIPVHVVPVILCKHWTVYLTLDIVYTLLHSFAILFKLNIFVGPLFD